MSKVLVISTSLRANSNSDILTEKLIEGAKASGHDVEHISLKGKNIGFCIGCLACQNTQKCVIKDDAVHMKYYKYGLLSSILPEIGIKYAF